MEDQYTEKSISNALKALEESELSQENLEAIEEIVRKMKLENKSEHTILAHLHTFKRIQPLIDFDLKSASKEEVESLALQINNESHPEYRGYSEWTKADDKCSIHVFYRYHSDTNVVPPPRCEDIRCSPAPSKKPSMSPEELLTVRDVEEMIDVCESPRDRAMLGLLWDSGMRPKELMELEWRDITIEDEGLMKVHIRNGKIGPRRIYLYESVPLIQKWRKEYPEPSNPPEPSEPLWVDTRNWAPNNKISTKSLGDIIKKAFKKADIPERRSINPYAWRKARATDMARKGMNLPTANKYFGWAQGSTSFERYIWLAEVDLENTIREIYGLNPVEREQKHLGKNLPEYEDVKSEEVLQPH